MLLTPETPTTTTITPSNDLLFSQVKLGITIYESAQFGLNYLLQTILNHDRFCNKYTLSFGLPMKVGSRNSTQYKHLDSCNLERYIVCYMAKFKERVSLSTFFLFFCLEITFEPVSLKMKKPISKSGIKIDTSDISSIIHHDTNTFTNATISIR